MQASTIMITQSTSNVESTCPCRKNALLFLDAVNNCLIVRKFSVNYSVSRTILPSWKTTNLTHSQLGILYCSRLAECGRRNGEFELNAGAINVNMLARQVGKQHTENSVDLSHLEISGGKRILKIMQCLFRIGRH